MKEGKLQPRTGNEGPEGKQRNSSTFSLTLALNAGRWLKPHPAVSSPGKKSGDHYTGGGGAQGRSGSFLENFASGGIRSPESPARSA